MNKKDPDLAVRQITKIIRNEDIFDSIDGIHLIVELLRQAANKKELAKELSLISAFTLGGSYHQKKIIENMACFEDKEDKDLSHIDLRIMQLLEEGIIEVCNVGGIVNTSLYTDYHFKAKSSDFPISISRKEIDIIYNTMLVDIPHGRCILEIGTGFGFSSSVMGLMLDKLQKDNQIYTVDSFVESGNTDKVVENRNVIPPCFLESNIAYQTACKIRERWGIRNVKQVLGISPFIFDEFSPQEPIGVAFIDGGHFYEQPTRDYLAIEKFLDKKSKIVLHDSQAASVQKLLDLLLSKGYKSKSADSSCKILILEMPC
ncbi:class I SAM-dependent methyltransferase [Catenovulum sp. SM1970]|uniref:class I SAM-dependent methyltransferase n=1 Tax=Marinifaba aquimaris TaxID=2741323 RepID=UPI001572E55E|nr:class I SAM-dependent methyltransferase [Marinifaba aquimaris]NTS76927.1 class I SAM-dependent methyltransferase [Marinifaba aquimaris]